MHISLNFKDKLFHEVMEVQASPLKIKKKPLKPKNPMLDVIDKRGDRPSISVTVT